MGEELEKFNLLVKDFYIVFKAFIVFFGFISGYPSVFLSLFLIIKSMRVSGAKWGLIASILAAKLATCGVVLLMRRLSCADNEKGKIKQRKILKIRFIDKAILINK